jgi:hypothetical protein
VQTMMTPTTGVGIYALWAPNVQTASRQAGGLNPRRSTRCQLLRQGDSLAVEERPEPDMEKKVRRLCAFRLSLKSDRPEDWP